MAKSGITLKNLNTIMVAKIFMMQHWNDRVQYSNF